MTQTAHPDIVIDIAGHGMRARFLSYGASLMGLWCDGHRDSLVVGLDDPLAYRQQDAALGAIVGRVANRLSGGPGQPFERNAPGGVTLHGGRDGSSRRAWHIAQTTPTSVTLTDHLPDGHMGFFGALDVWVTYSLLPGPVFRTEIESRARDDTWANFAPHPYWATGDGARLTVDADSILDLDETFVPHPEPVPVLGTRYDLRRGLTNPTRLSGGLDRNYCLSRQAGPMRSVARLDTGGLRLDFATTEPGLQVYDGGVLGEVPGLRAQQGLALEPQAWPDAPFKPWSDQVILPAGAVRRQVTEVRISQVL